MNISKFVLKARFNKSQIIELGACIAILLTVIIGCSRVSLVTSYYLIDYLPSPNNPKLIIDKPLPYKAQVKNFKIPRSFDSIRIIARFSTHQINYYRYSLWAVRPQLAVADLLVQHINAYNIFQKCQREFLDERPDYEITGEIFQIEKFESEQFSAAHLKMAYEFYEYDSNKRLVRHEFERETPIAHDNMSIFAKAISDIMSEEAENFMIKVLEHFQSLEQDSSKVGQ